MNCLLRFKVFAASIALFAAVFWANSAMGQGRTLRSLDAGGKVDISFCAIDISDGRIIASFDSKKLMTPASVQKLISSAVALEALGSDFSFKTRLGLYENKLIVIGDGDPLSGDPRVAEATGRSIYDCFDKWAALLKQRGISQIDALLLDDTILRERRHPDWPKNQLSRWYCAAAAGLNFNDNCIDVNFQSAAGTLKMLVSPQSSFIRVVDNISRRKSGNNIWRMTHSDDLSELRFTGRASSEGSEAISTAVDSPPMLYGRVLAGRLGVAGIKLTGDIRRAAVRADDGSIPQAVEIIATETTPLADVLTRMNKRSLNFMAECLLLRSDVACGGDGSYDSADKSAAKILTSRYAIDPAQLHIADGGGMSRNNAVSAEAICHILRKVANRPDSDIYIASLPVSGVDGTLKKRLKDFPTRVVAKTGTLSGVRSLAGYVLDSDGKPQIAFGVFCNSMRISPVTAKAAMDDFARELIKIVDSAQ